MTSVEDMPDAYPADLGGVDRKATDRCIDACVDCGQACTACADACLSEGTVGELTTCIRLGRPSAGRGAHPARRRGPFPGPCE